MGQSFDLGQIAPNLKDTCEEYLTSYRRAFAESVQRGDSGVAAVGAFAKALDGLLGALYCAADAAAAPRSERGETRSRIALVAVGGYGRGTLGLHSDVDVLFLCDCPTDPRAGTLAEGLLYPVWDMGLQIGHAVRGVDETLQLAREDIRTATTLVDLRWVAGDRSIVEDLRRAARRRVFDPQLDAFLNMLGEDTERRHVRFGDSLCLLEPEVKQGRGGLRDLDVVFWAAQVRWGGRTTEDHVRTGALLQREAEELHAAREFLWRVRNTLHLRAGRQQDRLTFEDQEEIATDLGFVDGIVLAVEQFMQAYYRHARVVADAAERMLERARPRRRRARAALRDLGDGTALFDGRITLVETERLHRDPALAMRFYRQVAKRELPPYPFARDAIARISVDEAWQKRLRESEEATQLFLELLTSQRAPVRRGSLLDELHRVGLTVAMIPELEPLTGRVQHDVYHVYTADVHMVRAVDRLRELRAGEHTQKMALASRLIVEAPRRAPLFLAVFLHALGKVHGGDRPDRGAEIARRVAKRLGLGSLDVDHVAWLIEEQHNLYHWATRRDTSDPTVLGELAERVATTERLRDLYLLTVAVISTTNPSALSAWKARMLEDLYFGLSSLQGTRPTGANRAAALREDVRVGFVGDKDPEVLETFLREMPDRYVLANPVDVIRRHARLARDTSGRLVGLHTAPGPSEELTEVVVISDDRPGLLADVAAVFAAHQIAVIDAQIYTRRKTAFDVFLVRREAAHRPRSTKRDTRPPPLNLDHVERDLRERLEGRVSALELLERAPTAPEWARRHRPNVATEVGVDNEASPMFTVVDVFTRDRVGVLYVIARTLHELGLTIAISKVNTEGERVADVFYVLTAEGGKLVDRSRVETARNELCDRLTAFHAAAEING